MTQTTAPHRREFLPPVPRTESGGHDSARPPAARDTDVRLGRVAVGSAAGYLLAWAWVILAGWVAMWSASYWVLLHTGALASVSRSLATILDAPLAGSGLLAVFTWPHALAAFVVTGGVLALGWFVTALGAVLVHNALTTVARGPRVQLKR